MVKVVFAGNDKMFDYLLLNAISVVRRTKEEVRFYCLTADLSKHDERFTPFSDEHCDLINSTIRQFNPKSVFKILHIDDLFWKHMGTKKHLNYRYTPYSLFRLLIGLIEELNGNIIYLDCDTMAAGDIAEFNKIDMSDTELCACRDYMGRFWINKNYFNAGSLYFNVDLCRKTGLFEKALDKFVNGHYYFGDQSALYHSVTKLKYYPGREFRFNEQRGLKEDTIIKHFCQGIKWTPFFHVFNYKQTDMFSIHMRLNIHEFDEDYDIYRLALSRLKKIEIDKANDKTPVLVIKNLVKKYDDLVAVNNISFELKRGALLGFLGMNGAGKSTTINVIASIIYKNSGEVYVDGLNLDTDREKIKSKIGIVFQSSVLDNALTVWENLMIRSNFYGLKKKEREERLDDIIQTLKLQPILKQPVGKLSGGQKRRVDIARAMVHNPTLLILDEPTTGLDPATRIDVWKLVDKIRTEKHMSVLLTSHYLEEADNATDVIIMNKGNIIAHGTPTELKNKFSHNSVIVYREENKDFEDKIKDYSFTYSMDNRAYHIIVKDTEEAQNLLSKFKDDIKDFEVKKGNLDDVFLKVTGDSFEKEKEE